MIKVLAKIRLYTEGLVVRKAPIYSGYRPVFNFVDEVKTAGQIILIKQEKIIPGEECVVEIWLLYRTWLGDDFGIGKKFTFGEGGPPLGEGEITEVKEITNDE